MTARTPPQALEAERALLGALILEPEAIPRAIEAIETADFYRAAHAKAFAALVALHRRDERADLVTLAAELERRGELEAAGGAAGLAALLEQATTAANLEHHARLIRDAATRRALLRASESIADQAHDPAVSPAEALEQAAVRIRDAAGPGASSGLTRAARWDESLSAEALVRPEPLLAGGALSAGDLAVIAGAPGLGKSRLAIELGVALSRGAPWLGLETSSRPMRVGYIAAEFTTYRWVERLVQLLTGRRFGGGAPLLEAYRALPLATPPGCFKGIPGQELDRALNLLSDAATEALIAAISAFQLEVVFLDPLFRMMNGEDETNEFFGKLIENADRVRFKTGAALVFVHHVRKGSPGSDRDAADPLDMIRGGSKLRDAVNTALYLDHLDGGLGRIRFVKANYARKPDPIYHRIPDDGGPTLIELAPEGRRDANAARVLEWCRAQAGRFTSHAVAAGLGDMGLRTVQRHLKNLVETGELVPFDAGRGSVAYSASPDMLSERDTTTRDDRSPVSSSELFDGNEDMPL